MILYPENVTSYDVSTKRMTNISSTKEKHMNLCKDKIECTWMVVKILNWVETTMKQQEQYNTVPYIIRDDIKERLKSVIKGDCNTLWCFEKKHELPI